ncbi:MurR/RpiR family transcriptional regulator [Ligilactobacillus sp. WILCCON 0076]|uniref:MurR/RpiR family transcriptional regulator n=1 Tax=Ligilactobacillus ubinensis TaxID=2876789 RepID=A0A9X2JL69_9LACO|nr:MurR/RpiR family transcriptional regulator [Ligilactobacillus ubinensis]MCP0886678.1 MurR/RpiR family transcriptional regulator [Ligilactobacillus ubinensis]
MLKKSDSIIDVIYSHLSGMTQTDEKIAQLILDNPKTIVDYTISELADKAEVSAASVSRFCKNLQLAGFHQLKIEIARVSENKASYYKNFAIDSIQKALSNIADNKKAEVTRTLSSIETREIKLILKLLNNCRILQVAAEGNTYPVAADAIYRFNQIGRLAIGAESWQTAIGQTLNLGKKDVLLIISNSGESKTLLKQISIAQKNNMKIIAITNRSDSPIALKADFHIQTAVRQRVLQSEYYFSRVAAMTAVEALFLLLIADDDQRVELIRKHELLISDSKI